MPGAGVVSTPALGRRLVTRQLVDFANGIEHRRAQMRRRRFGGRLGQRRRAHLQLGVLAGELVVAVEQPVERGVLGVGQRAGRPESEQVEVLVPRIVVRVHEAASSPSTVRSRNSPSRMRVFAVPNAMPRWSATSTWVSPP